MDTSLTSSPSENPRLLAVVDYLKSPEFLRASAGTTRLVSKLEAAISAREIYEAHQILRTIFFRFSRSDDKFEPLNELLFRACLFLFEADQPTSAQDLALLFLETCSKLLAHRPSRVQVRLDSIKHHREQESLDYLVSDKISLVAHDMPETDIGRKKFIAEALKILTPKLVNQQVLHYCLATRFHQSALSSNLTWARYHYLRCASLETADEIANFLIQYHQRFGCQREKELFLTQFIFQYLCSQSLNNQRTDVRQAPISIRNDTMSTINSKQEIKTVALQIFRSYQRESPVSMSQLSPLLNFTLFIIELLDSADAQKFELLCKLYQSEWKQDPSYGDYLARIGATYFNITSPSHQQRGGVFGSLLQSLFEGNDFDDEDSSIDLD